MGAEGSFYTSFLRCCGTADGAAHTGQDNGASMEAYYGG